MIVFTTTGVKSSQIENDGYYYFTHLGVGIGKGTIYIL